MVVELVGALERLARAALLPDKDASDGKKTFPASSLAGKSVNESSTNCESHSSSAASSLCATIGTENIQIY